MDDERQLLAVLPVKDIDQPLVRVPLHDAFGGDPVRTAGPAGIVRAVCDIEDHRIRLRTEAADGRARVGLGVGTGGRRERGNQEKCE
jgi:hypothetical protein